MERWGEGKGCLSCASLPGAGLGKGCPADLGTGVGVMARGNWSPTELQQLDWGQEEPHGLSPSSYLILQQV